MPTNMKLYLYEQLDGGPSRETLMAVLADLLSTGDGER